MKSDATIKRMLKLQACCLYQLCSFYFKPEILHCGPVEIIFSAFHAAAYLSLRLSRVQNPLLMLTVWSPGPQQSPLGCINMNWRSLYRYFAPHPFPLRCVCLYLLCCSISGVSGCSRKLQQKTVHEFIFPMSNFREKSQRKIQSCCALSDKWHNVPHIKGLIVFYVLNIVSTLSVLPSWIQWVCNVHLICTSYYDKPGAPALLLVASSYLCVGMAL